MFGISFWCSFFMNVYARYRLFFTEVVYGIILNLWYIAAILYVCICMNKNEFIHSKVLIYIIQLHAFESWFDTDLHLQTV